MQTKIIFMGTPQFSVGILESLINHPDYDVIAVLTQPDRPVGRKKRSLLTANPSLSMPDPQFKLCHPDSRPETITPW